MLVILKDGHACGHTGVTIDAAAHASVEASSLAGARTVVEAAPHVARLTNPACTHVHRHVYGGVCRHRHRHCVGIGVQDLVVYRTSV